MYACKQTFPSTKDFRHSGYVLHLASSGGALIAAGKSSTNYLHIIEKATFQLVTSLGGRDAHSDTICDVEALDKFTAASCGRDGLVKIWDSRQPSREVWSCKAAHASKDAEVNALASSGDLLAVSSGSQAKIFDIRTKGLYHEYTELHSEAITGMQFQSSRLLVTCSEDGMIAVADVYDLQNEDEGQAPLVAMNTQGGLRGLRVFDNTIFAISATESLSVWNLDGTPRSEFDTVEKIRSHPLLDIDGSMGYIIDIYDEPGVGYTVLAGSSRGDALLANISKPDLPVVASFRSEGGHTEVIRDAVRDEHGHIFTGGEDGKIIQWTLCDISATPSYSLGPSDINRKNRPAPY